MLNYLFLDFGGVNVRPERADLYSIPLGLTIATTAVALDFDALCLSLPESFALGLLRSTSLFIHLTATKELLRQGKQTFMQMVWFIY